MPNAQSPFATYPNKYPRLLSEGERSRLNARMQAGLTLAEALNEVVQNYLPKGLPFEQRFGFEVLVPELQGAQPLTLPPTVDQLLDEVRKLYKEYDHLCQQEYAQIEPPVGRMIEGIATDKDHRYAKEDVWKYYQAMRQLYFAKDEKTGRSLRDRVGTPFLNELNKIEPKVKFLNTWIYGVHPEMTEVLNHAEGWLNVWHAKDTAAKGINKIGGFDFRKNANNSNKLSYHALGRAIDIDADWNPNLFDKKATAIDAILQSRGLDVQFRVKSVVVKGSMASMAADAKGSPEDRANNNFQRISMISSALREFLNQWMDDWNTHQRQNVPPESPEMEDNRLRNYKLLEDFLIAFGAAARDKDRHVLSQWNEIEKKKRIAFEKAMGQVEFIRKYGIVTIPLEIFAALMKSNARTLIDPVEVHSGVDIMHFERQP